ncbi:hypothetical protein [Mycobacterium servetii]|uniref:Ferredoxin n=1 Tax=Mycobacterium servetii TaxID=3237418 RepID=A0ABV4C3M2_9MYCO
MPAACAAACKACGDVCEGHGNQLRARRVFAEVCRRCCEKACQEMTKSLGWGRAPKWAADRVGGPIASAVVWQPSRRRYGSVPRAPGPD